MKAPWSGQLSAAKTGWLVMLLFFGWLGYLLVPVPKPEPPPTLTPVKQPPSRLVALGLPDNVDLEHLPEFFALYMDKAEWIDDKAIFAYWNPGSNSYSYFIEATRLNGALRFRIFSRAEAFGKVLMKNGDETLALVRISDDKPELMRLELTTELPTHPLVFLQTFQSASYYWKQRTDWQPGPMTLPTTSRVDLKAEPITLPNMEVKNPPTFDVPRKK